MSDMKKLMENWKSYEKETLNEAFLPFLPRWLASKVIEDHDTSTPEGRQAMVADAKKGYDSEMNYMMSTEDRKDFQNKLDNNATDDDLFRSTKGQMGTGTDMTRKDLEDMLRARWSDLAFDPSDPLDYASAGLYATPVAGQVGKLAVGANKARKLHDKYSTFRKINKAIPALTKAGTAVEAGQATAGVGAIAGAALDRATGADVERAEASSARWDDLYKGTDDDDDFLRNDLLAMQLDEGVKSAAAKVAKKLKKTPKPKKPTQVLSGIDAATDAGAASMTLFTRLDGDALDAARKLKAQKIAGGASEVDAKKAMAAQYQSDRAELVNWTNGYNEKYLKSGQASADEFYGITGSAEQRASRMINFDKPGNSNLWRDTGGVPQGPIQQTRDWAAKNPKKAKAAKVIGGLGTAAGIAGTGMALKSAADTKKALEGDPTVTAATADPEATAETEPGPTAGDPKPIIPAAQPTVVSEPSSPVSPENLKSGDEVEIDGVKYRADESANRSKRVGNIIREEVIRYLNRRAK